MHLLTAFPSPFRFLALFFFLAFTNPAQAQIQALKVSPNGRFLMKADGSPFFYLADTAWELFHRLNYQEAYTYLSNRAGKEFNVIQCVLLSEIEGLVEPNANGDLPLVDLDPARPNEKYFQQVDRIIELAASFGLYLAILPTWGSWVVEENHPLFESHQIFTVENARTYGAFLGRRYRDKPNIIWVLGGDRPATGYEKVWEAMARGLKEGDGGGHLMTYHPRGQSSSSAFWHSADWLDFNMVQSGHATRLVNSYDFISHDYELLPPKPTFDGETNYEDIPVNFSVANGWFDDYDIRVSSYYSVFAGGFGITYGCNNIWQMNTGKRPIVYARKTWRESLDLPGAYQMRHLKNLIESRPFFTRIPDQRLLMPTENPLVPFEGRANQHVQITRDGTPGKNDASYIMAYLTISRGLKINTSVIPGKRLKVWWYDPRHGTAIPVGETENKGFVETGWNTLPWHDGAGPDWVFVIDDASKNYPAPGKK